MSDFEFDYSPMERLIDEKVTGWKSERNRKILKLRFLQGMTYARGRGRNAKRDAMGRYSRDYRGGSYERGYSRDGKEEYKEQLREMMDSAPDEQTRMSIKRMIDNMQ